MHRALTLFKSMFGYIRRLLFEKLLDFSFFRLQSQHFYCLLVDGSFLLEQSYKRQNLSTAPHREDCESFLRAMCSGSQVRALGALLSKHTLINTRTHALKPQVRRREEENKRRGEEQRGGWVRPLFSLTAVGEISLFLTGK